LLQSKTMNKDDIKNQEVFAPKQLEFILNSNAHWNLAHGSVRSGKTVGTLFRFMQACLECPDSQIFMVGHSSETIYQNAIRLLLESEELSYFRPFCSWAPGKRQINFKDKQIHTLGAKDEGAIGGFQGKTFSLVYCDEITLYPESIIDMIDTRLSRPYSMGFASMNPAHPTHKVKQWIDKAEAGDPNYYSLHYTLDDNPYVDENYKQRIRDSLSGLFYKRNYLGEWCLAEGAIFDFFDRSIHVVDDPPRAAEYWIAGIDYGTVNPFACVLLGVSTGRYDRTGPIMWVEKEYYYDPKKTGRQKTNSEFAQDVEEFLEPYSVQAIYIDPSADAFQLELKRRNLRVVHANNSVQDGIQDMTSKMKKGSLFVCKECVNLIREIETYVWDSKQAAQGKDAPLKKDDHACVVGDTVILLSDGLNYPIKDLVGEELIVQTYDEEKNAFGIAFAINVSMTGKDKQIYYLELENGKFLRATPDHKVYTKRGYTKLQNIFIDDEVLCYKKNEVIYSRVTKIQKDGIEHVFCMSVPTTSNFITNGIVSHNCDALRYACYTHIVSTYDPYKQEQYAREYRENRFSFSPRNFQ